MQWIGGRPAAATHDLASSDVTLPGDGSDGLVPHRLQDRPELDGDLEERLAAAYGLDRRDVWATAGATGATLLACHAVASGDAGNRVLVERPAYEPLVTTPRLCGLAVDRFQRPLDAGAPLDADRVAAALEAETALVVVTNRHNPTGRRHDREALRAVAETVADADATLLVDEVYAPVGEPSGGGPFGGPTAAGLPATLVCNSLTKFLGFGGVGLGWLAGDGERLGALEEVAVHRPSVPEPSRALGGRALAAAANLAGPVRTQLRANHDRLAEFRADRPSLVGPVHDGATMAALGHEDIGADECARVAEDAGVLVVPGRFFDGIDRVRICSCGPTEATERALATLGDALAAV